MTEHREYWDMQDIDGIGIVMEKHNLTSVEFGPGGIKVTRAPKPGSSAIAQAAQAIAAGRKVTDDEILLNPMAGLPFDPQEQARRVAAERKGQ